MGNKTLEKTFTLLRAKSFLAEQLQKDVDLALFDALRPFIRKWVEKESFKEAFLALKTKSSLSIFLSIQQNVC